MALMARCFAPAFRKNGLASASMAARSIQTQSLTPEQNLELLVKQRKLRPSSPHFTIYEPQLTWYSSIISRFTGMGLSAGFYAFAISYAVAPAVGLPFDSAAMVDLWHSLPEWFKLTSKVIVGVPFWYHSFNGLRHLAWDVGKFIDIKGAYAAGYAVIAATAVATTITTFFV